MVKSDSLRQRSAVNNGFAEVSKNYTKMSKGVRLIKRWGIVLLYVLPPVSILLIAYFHRQTPQYLPKYLQRTSLEGVEHLNNVKSNLFSLSFETVDDSARFRADIEALPVIRGNLITSAQSVALKDSVYNLMMAFHEGTYESYRKFRTPIKADFNPKAIIYHSKLLKALYLRPGEELPVDAEELDKMFWQRNYGGNAFSNYWESICITNILIEIDRTNVMPPSLFRYAQEQDWNEGLREVLPTFTFQRNPDIILKQDGSLLFATLTIDVKPAPPDPIYPVYIRYYWDTKSDQWLPWEMTSGNSQKRKRDPMF